MKHTYEIPTVTIKRRRASLWAACGVLLIALFGIRHVWFMMSWGRYWLMADLWMAYFGLTAFQWSLSWLERPYETTPVQMLIQLGMQVTVNIPVFNEDPVVLDRVLFALFCQTRLPSRVQVVDDGSAVDYSEVRTYWMDAHPSQVEFSWVEQANAGKKRAQARTFRGDPADVFVTLDSDTVLEAHAIEEGLKPFADPRVQSVAGLELAWNHDWNLLTRMNSARQLTWQLVTCSSQNVLRGSLLINRGTFALYRGDMIRDVLPAYVEETFCGRPIYLGDDTFLTTMALCRGRAVQQPSAVCLAMYPENLSHHLRQWLRWMRGTTLRTVWRLRYLRPLSWGCLYAIVSTWWFLASLAMTGILAYAWPASASYTRTMLAVGVIWAWIMASRLLVVKRSDQPLAGILSAVALYPIAVLWVFVALRLVRIYGTFTFLRQSWTTRASVEVGAERADAPPAVERVHSS